MKNIYKFYMALAMAIVFTLIVTNANAGINDRFSKIELEEDNYILMPEISTAPATPQSGYGKISVRANNIYFKDDLGVETSMIAAAAGGVSNLDGAYDGGGAGAGAEIAVDSGPVILTGTHAATNTLNVTASGTGHCIAFTNTGTGNDLSGTAGWSITKAGLATFATFGATTVIADMDFDDGVTDSPSLTFTDATDETAVFAKTDAGVLGLTTDATDGLNVLVGNIWIGNGAPGTATMDGEDAYIEGELEVDGAVELDGAVNIDGAVTMTSTVGITGLLTLENGLTIDNAVNNSLEFNENSEELKMVFGANILELASTSGIVELSIFDDAADVVISHSANGAADDFYITQTGAQDASLIISSTGTAADALQITTTAGGIVVTAASTLTVSGSFVYGGIQDIAAGGTSTVAVLTNQVFTVGADAGGDIVTLANGTAGQIVYFVCEDEAGTTTITPATLNGGTSITFDALGDTVILLYTTGTGWSIVGGNSYSII